MVLCLYSCIAHPTCSDWSYNLQHNLKTLSFRPFLQWVWLNVVESILLVLLQVEHSSALSKVFVLFRWCASTWLPYGCIRCFIKLWIFRSLNLSSKITLSSAFLVICQHFSALELSGLCELLTPQCCIYKDDHPLIWSSLPLHMKV